MRIFGTLAPEWVAYRLVDEKWCTLGELDSLSLDDVLDANDILDALAKLRKRDRGTDE